MIEQTSFLGLPLRTQRQRRTLVLGYYGILLVLALLGLWRGGSHIGFLIPQVVTVGGLLGGIKMGGPVKYYNSANLPPMDGSGLQSLNLGGRKPFSLWPGSQPIDERERAQRDAAHFRAYRIVATSLVLAGIAYWVGANTDPTWIAMRMPLLIWVLLIYVISLPQAVLLWTEPQAPLAEVVELPAAQA